MPDALAADVLPGGSAQAALAFLTEMSPDLRAAAILDSDGSVLAAEGDAEGWGDAARALFAAADAVDPEAAEQVHVATEQGEVFGLRHAGFTAVAVSERYALASLLFFDIRSTLRELARGGTPGGTR
jgi:hypothetical protein